MEKYFSVAGFKFYNEREYNLAQKENETIEYLKSKLDTSNIKMVYALYSKLIEGNTLKTVVGKAFLKKLYDILKESDFVGLDQLPLIRVDDISKDNVKVYYRTQYKTKYKSDTKIKNELEKAKTAVASLRIVAIIFGIIIGIMFYVVLKSDTATYDNAKNAVLDEYSQWEQELEQREAAIKEKEDLQ